MLNPDSLKYYQCICGSISASVQMAWSR